MTAVQATRRAWRTFVMGVLIVVVVFIMPPLAISASTMFKINKLQLIPSGSVVDGEYFGRHTVLQQRTLAWGMSARWQAAVLQAEVVPINGHAVRRVTLVCRGDGDYFYQTSPRTRYLSLKTWAGDPACALEPGRWYMLHGQWTFSVLRLWSWTVTADSDPVLIAWPEDVSSIEGLEQ